MDSLAARFRDEVFSPYLDLLKAQFRVHQRFASIRSEWEQGLSMERLAHGPFLERAQIYASGVPVEALGLHPGAVKAIAVKLNGRGLYEHQTDAIRRVVAGENVIVATGTSSGKTLCFQIPILEALLRDPRPGLRAVIIYPLNALVNDQLEEWEKLLAPYPQLAFGKFTGQTPRDQKDYEERLRQSLQKRMQSSEPTLSEAALQKRVDEALRVRLAEEAETPNHLRHRAAIRSHHPQVLITNFSMLEYLLVRPVDAPIFEAAHLQFIVLDEAHAYRGVQATEIGYLVRRLKDRLGQPQPRCIATSATLGDRNDPASRKKVCQFACRLFDAVFDEQNLIYGTPAIPDLIQPTITPSTSQYIAAANALREDPDAPVRKIAGHLSTCYAEEPLGTLLSRDQNLFRLRTRVLTEPRLAARAAEALWPGDPQSEPALHALFEIVAEAKREPGREDLLPTRLHYFVKAQQGLHVCLRVDCPERARRGGEPSIFPSRKNDEETPEGLCPHCRRGGFSSRLVELVSCRKCGYLYGALQDLGPRFRQNPETASSPQEERFDNFETELGWAADSFWSYFSIADELPYPTQSRPDEDDEDPLDLIAKPARVNFCVSCGKKVEVGLSHDCAGMHVRELLIFHRQCPAHSLANLDMAVKKPLTCCPNCGARNNSGVELVRRFQESEDETGLAMALPLAHFRIGLGGSRSLDVDPRKVLCFTDHRQRAAAFPSLLEEESFTYDFGRKLVSLLQRRAKAWSFEDLGRELGRIADEHQGNPAYDPNFFLPVSRLPEEREKRDRENDPADLSSWMAEVFAYFGVPDSARESAEDLGLVTVEYELDAKTQHSFCELLPPGTITEEEAKEALQTLLGYVRQARAFSLPARVPTDAPAFGRIGTDIFYAEKRDGRTNTRGWLSRRNKDGTYQHNAITSYLSRLLGLDAGAALDLASRTWIMLTANNALKRDRDDKWQLFHDHLKVHAARARYVCRRCGVITTWSAHECCPRKGCEGPLQPRPFDAAGENAIAQWVAGTERAKFASLRSEEHTAQINKDLAKEIEDAFRGDGVNLLSSTTTFEMGINIGDLQKVLLRNAPPTPASYVQRVGRAGRGVDKNSICVTLCRGTKYDLDMWLDPARLMSGAMRAPTVFLENRIIAQRHFNAVAFAAFLRQLDTAGQLRDKKQSIRLEGFLPITPRTNLPKAWRKLDPPDAHFDFSAWLEGRRADDLFHALKGNVLLECLGGFDEARLAALDGERSYRAIVGSLGAELESLLAERRERVDEGLPIEEVDRSVQNLLGEDVIAVLARLGFLPRYAFPLDVVPLETTRSRWASESEVELSRDRAIAISEFAPGAQVVARKRVFTSGGLYIASSQDKPDRRWFAQCQCCGQIRTARRKDDLARQCPVCQQSIPELGIRGFVEPEAFSIRFEGKRHNSARFTKSTLIRQRQSLTHFIDAVEDSGFEPGPRFRLALLPRGQLFRYNLGSGRKGFMLCPACGTSQPMSAAAGAQHRLLRAWSSGRGSANCLCTSVYRGIAYAHQFQSFCLVVRPIVPVGSVESLAYALHKGACRCLELDASDIGVAWRFLNRRNDHASGKEIVLFDRTPGGAGFVADAKKRWPEVEAAARSLCSECTCEHACYDCLKDFGNQAHHEQLDRHLALDGLGVAEMSQPGLLPITDTP